MKSLLKLLPLALAAMAGLFLAAPAAAADPSAAFTERANDLVRLFKGEVKPEQIFAPEFLAQVPVAQVNAITGQLKAQSGAVVGLGQVVADAPHLGTVHVEFERAILVLRLGVEAAAPHRINTLLVTGSQTRDDSIDKVLGELRTLPGSVSFAVARLGDGAPTMLHAIEPDQALGIGSAFKLFILAELSRQVKAGEREWDDVVRLERVSLPSGVLQEWPIGSPLTLHTLAGLMISVSDNTATDALLHTVGREKVEALLPTLGIADPARNRPFLSTYELFVLKGALDQAATQAYRGADEAERRAMLPRIAATSRSALDLARYSGAPVYIGELEWFASASDLVRTMDWLRRNGGEEALNLMTINPGIGETVAQGFDYFGYKGGSEQGVLNLTFLARNKAGVWHVVTGSWNNPAAALDNSRFVALMSRAVQLID